MTPKTLGFTLMQMISIDFHSKVIGFHTKEIQWVIMSINKRMCRELIPEAVWSRSLGPIPASAKASETILSNIWQISSPNHSHSVSFYICTYSEVIHYVTLLFETRWCPCLLAKFLCNTHTVCWLYVMAPQNPIKDPSEYLVNITWYPHTHTHRIHVWNIYQHLPHKWPKCR